MFKVGDRVICFERYIGIIKKIVPLNNRLNLHHVEYEKSPNKIQYVIVNLRKYKESVRIISEIDPYGEEDWNE